MKNEFDETYRCPQPGCGQPREQFIPRDPRCMCGKPLLVVIPPGEHIHPCPVHPDYIVRGPEVTW